MNEIDTSKIPLWKITTDDGINKLVREFKFENFKQALEFANSVGNIAEREDHHPIITVSWGKTSIVWWTHEIGGLQALDFELARECDVLFAKSA